MDFLKIKRSDISNIKQIIKEQNGTKNRIYGIIDYNDGPPYIVTAGTKSGKRSLEGLLNLYENKYKKLCKNGSDFKIIEIVKED